MEVVVAVKQAEVDLLRQQLAQMSSDLSRNLAVSAWLAVSAASTPTNS
jgi:hypothetical protein